jgi:phosphohistidine phosphatase
MAAPVRIMRKLYLLRHAKSSWGDAALDDFDRPLNDRGRRSARRMAAYLDSARIRPALVLVSAARRTRETFDILASKLGGVPAAIEEDLYATGKAELLQRLHRLDDHLASVMVIGHNPGLERLAGALAGKHGEPQALARLHDKFPTGALAVLETKAARWAELQAGSCRLVDFVRPKDLGDDD